MCGIAGKINLSNTPINDADHQLMNEVILNMKYRGPDGNGIKSEQNWILGHTRLAIMDPKSGQQPWKDEKSGVTISYNGEIYNFLELKKELEIKGYSFRTNCDTEVVLSSYLEWGEKCIDKFNGFFAFIICDVRKNALFAARDRIGIKPFFYFKDDKQFVCASTVPSVVKLARVNKSLNLETVSHYLGTGKFIFGDKTLIQGVQSLLPGHSISINLNNNEFKIKKYWQKPILSAEEKRDLSFKDSVAEIKELMNESVKMRLMSDVPLGSFLSGGLDSAIIAKVADKYSNFKLPLFCAGSDDDLLNEYQYAEMMANELDLDLTQIKMTHENFMSDWDVLIENKGMPLSTPNEISIFNLARELKKQCTVTLTGEGADEIFGGYIIPHFSAYDYDRCARTAEDADSASSFAMSMMMQYGRSFFINDTDHYTTTTAWFNYLNKTKIFNGDIWNKLDEDDAFFAFYEDFFESVDKCSTFDKRMHLHADINLESLLARVDNCTMSASVEARVPFTDHRLIEKAFTLPDNFKMDWINQDAKLAGKDLTVAEIDQKCLLESKRLVREAYRQDLPREIVDRKKMSFPIPFQKWFHGPMLDELKDLCYNSKISQELFNQKEIENLFVTQNPSLWVFANLCKWSEIVM